MKKLHQRAMLWLFAVLLLSGSVAWHALAAPAKGASVSAKESTVSKDTLEVHFMDVGQGDATLLICGEHAMLVDVGDDSKGTAVQNYLKKQKIQKLDYLILTHPDADHIGGAPVIIQKFAIGQVFVSNYEKDNKTYRKLVQALDYKRLKAVTPKTGAQYLLGSAVITVLAPNDTYDNPNDSSIAFLIQNGDNRFLFTGDAGEAAEKDILNTKLDISADVYKTGHHGSKYSTSAKFFRKVAPDYAVISCAEGNSYGHPHAETLDRFRISGVSVYRTDEDGTIIAVSDGKELTFNVPASTSWKAGEPSQKSSKQAAAPKTNVQEPASSTAIQPPPQEDNANTTALTYVLNTKTKKFHRPSCSSLPTANRQDCAESRESVIAQGYEPCKRCNP